MLNESKRKLRFATAVYWVLLLYIIIALLWWALSLERQNEAMFQLQKQHLNVSITDHNSPEFIKELKRIENIRDRNIAKYIGEGSLFLLLIFIGAVFIYRSVRRQFVLQQQQQNFVMAITHELKTPLSVSRLNLETLQRHNLDESKKEKLLQMTLQETLRLDTLINNILISSQLEGHSYTGSREDLSLSDLTTYVIQQFRNRYPERKLVEKIQNDIDINGDALLLKLLVSNLLENAHKYSPKDKPIEILLSKRENKVQLEVKDEGAGIEETERKNVFKKFYRIGNEQTRRNQGTGLGLYICKKIAETHKGSICIASNQPQGSTFIVSF